METRSYLVKVLYMMLEFTSDPVGFVPVEQALGITTAACAAAASSVGKPLCQLDSQKSL
jgi:hypothetical protein